MAAAELQRLARRPRPTTVGGVVARMEVIEAALPERHGVATFTRVYRWTTEQVGAAIIAEEFEAPEDMTALDIAFADLFFDAVDAWATDQHPPAAWRPLFERCEDPAIAPLSFALAGVHAHINRDLAVALVRTSSGRLLEDSPQFRDFQRIDTVLDRTSDQIRDRILPPALVAADAALGERDDAVMLRAIVTARRAAWEVAERLSRVAAVPALFDAALAVLDASVGATARAILDPDGVIGA
jgi:hypothetical protein